MSEEPTIERAEWFMENCIEDGISLTLAATLWEVYKDGWKHGYEHGWQVGKEEGLKEAFEITKRGDEKDWEGRIGQALEEADVEGRGFM